MACSRRDVLAGMAALAAALRVGAVAAVPAATQWHVVVDDLHLDFTTTGVIRTATATIARALFDARVLASVRTVLPPAVPCPVDATTAWSAIAAAIRGVTGHGLRVDDIVEALANGRPREMRARVARLVDAAGRVIDVGPGAPTSAVLLLVSLGHRIDDAAIERQLTGLAERAARARVPVVPLSPELLRPIRATARPPRASAADLEAHARWTRGSLERLARDTGGTLWQGDETPAGVTARLSF